MTRMFRFLIAVFLITGLSPTSHASAIKMMVSSGTGFFISADGYLLTNKHVVSNCQRIIVFGAVTPRIAEVVATSYGYDLALLKVAAQGVQAGAFRTVASPVKTGERVVIVGYPGKAAQTGQTVTREAKITNDKGPMGEDTWIQLSDIVEQGNSGGPLMDSAGNVIGVIVAKAVKYTYQKSDPANGSYSQSGVAIAPAVVQAFLDRYRVRYQFSEIADDYTTDRLTEKAHRFVAGIRCEFITDVR